MKQWIIYFLISYNFVTLAQNVLNDPSYWFEPFLHLVLQLLHKFLYVQVKAF